MQTCVAHGQLVEHAQVARENNTRRSIDELKNAGYWAVALESGEGSVDIYTADIPTPAALIVGAEASGVSRPVLKACDLTVRLPMPGPVESLNAAVAGSVALFEVYRRGRQRNSVSAEKQQGDARCSGIRRCLGAG
jgi:23S rRNA (guanosine2251-2'-O)-methyltransferase